MQTFNDFSRSSSQMSTNFPRLEAGEKSITMISNMNQSCILQPPPPLSQHQSIGPHTHQNSSSSGGGAGAGGGSQQNVPLNHTGSNSNNNNKPPFSFESHKWNNIPEILVDFFNVVNQKIFEMENSQNQYRVKTDQTIKQQCNYFQPLVLVEISLAVCQKGVEEQSMKLNQSKQATTASMTELKTQIDGKLMQLRVKVDDTLEKFNNKIAENSKLMQVRIDAINGNVSTIRTELESTKALCDETIRLQEDQTVVSEILLKNTTIAQIVQAQSRFEDESAAISTKISEAISKNIQPIQSSIMEHVEKQLKDFAVKSKEASAASAASALEAVKASMPTTQMVNSIQAKFDKEMKQVLSKFQLFTDAEKKKVEELQANGAAAQGNSIDPAQIEKHTQQISDVLTSLGQMRTRIDDKCQLISLNVQQQITKMAEISTSKTMEEINKLQLQLQNLIQKSPSESPSISNQGQHPQHGSEQNSSYDGQSIKNFGVMSNALVGSKRHSVPGKVTSHAKIVSTTNEIDVDDDGEGEQAQSVYEKFEKQLSDLSMKLESLSGQVNDLEQTTEAISKQKSQSNGFQGNKLHPRDEIRFQHISKLSQPSSLQDETPEGLGVRLLMKGGKSVNSGGNGTTRQRSKQGGSSNVTLNPLPSSAGAPTAAVAAAAAVSHRSRFGSSGFEQSSTLNMHNNNNSFVSNSSVGRKGDFASQRGSDEMMKTAGQCYYIPNERGSTGESPEKISSRRSSLHNSRRSLILNANVNAAAVTTATTINNNNNSVSGGGFTAGLVVERGGGKTKNVPPLDFMPQILINNNNNNNNQSQEMSMLSQTHSEMQNQLQSQSFMIPQEQQRRSSLNPNSSAVVGGATVATSSSNGFMAPRQSVYAIAQNVSTKNGSDRLQSYAVDSPDRFRPNKISPRKQIAESTLVRIHM